MPEKLGNFITRGTRARLVRVSLDRDPEIGKQKYLNKTICGSFREAKLYRMQVSSNETSGVCHSRRRRSYAWRWHESSDPTSIGREDP